MSRSWERKVKKNMNAVNKARRKSGSGNIVLNAPKSNAARFTGRNIILPIVLLIFIGLYNAIVWMDVSFEPNGMYYITVLSYLLLAALFYFRKPYLSIGKDYVQSRRMMGDKQLYAGGIKEIKTFSGYIIIVPVSGSSWSFSKTFNRFEIDKLTAALKEFANKHNITWTEN